MKGLIRRVTPKEQTKRAAESSNVLEYENVPKEMIIDTYYNCIKAANNYVGGPSAIYRSTPSQLTSYADRLMTSIPEDKRNKLKAAALKDTKKLNVKLEVTLVEAEDLVTKDPNGVSDPFCQLSVNRVVKKSKTVHKTLHPRWNETFDFNVKTNEDILTLEIWDEDPRTLTATLGQLTEVKGIKGFYRYMKDVGEAAIPGGKYVDDFIGSATIAIKDIPFVDADLWLPLKIDKTNIKGGIHITAKFEVIPTENQNTDRLLQEHTIMCMFCLRDHLRCSQIDECRIWYSLKDAFSPTGFTLLKQHALQNNLRHFHHSTCIWLCVSNIHLSKEHAYTYLLLFECLQNVRNYINVKEKSLSHRSLLANLREFDKFCCQQFSQLHSVFPLNDKYACIQLQALLCLTVVLATFLTDVRNRIKEAIKIDAEKWHLKTFANMGLNKLNENTAENLKDVLRAYFYNQEIANGIFVKAWNETYTKHICLSLDDVLKKHVKPLIRIMVEEAYSDDSIQTLLHVFYTLKVLVDYTVESMTHVNNRPRLEMEKYTEWFGQNMMIEWFRWAVKTCLPWIQKSVELEEMEPISYDVKAGISSKDLLDILQTRLLHLWQSIDWPHVSSTMQLSETLRDCVLCYANEIANKIEEEGYYDLEGEFEISSKLCVALNNFTAVVNSLEFMKEEIKVNLHSRQEIEDMNNILSPLQEASDYVEEIMNATCLEIVAKVGIELVKLITSVAGSTTENAKRRALFNISGYTNDCLALMLEYLDDVAFKLIMKEMWRIVVDTIEDHVDDCKKNKVCSRWKRPKQLNGLLELLNQMLNIFHGEGSGLHIDELENENYQRIKAELVASELIKSERDEKI